MTAAEYAGHGTRRKESYYHTFDELVQDMTDMVREVRNPEMLCVILAEWIRGCWKISGF